MVAAIGALAVTATIVGCGNPSGPTTEPATAPAAEVAEKPSVAVSLVADRSSVAPGSELRLGLHFEIRDGWHIYWSNPGESGMATRVALEAPAGLSVSPLRYPGPRRFVTAGEITTYGYDDDALMVASAMVPRDAAAIGDSATISAEVRWLSCKQSCIPGKKKLEISLPIGEDQSSDEAALFERHARSLPLPWSELTDGKAAWDRHELVVSVADADQLELFPVRTERLAIAAQALDYVGDAARLRVRYRALDNDAPLPTGQGVVRVERGTSAAYYELELPWPETLGSGD